MPRRRQAIKPKAYQDIGSNTDLDTDTKYTRRDRGSDRDKYTPVNKDPDRDSD